MKNFTDIDAIFAECEAIGFCSIQVVNGDGKTLVNGTATKNPWDKNKRDVAAFLEKAEQPYTLRVRKTVRGTPEEWMFTPGKQTKSKVLEDLPTSGSGISLNLYTKLLTEKSNAEVRAQIAEAEVKVLKSKIEELTGENPDEIQEDEPETLADRAMNFVQSPTIQPMIMGLAEMAMEGIRGLGNSKDEATAYTMQLLLKKVSGQVLTPFEIGVVSQNFNTFGPKTQAIIGQIMQ